VTLPTSANADCSKSVAPSRVRIVYRNSPKSRQPVRQLAPDPELEDLLLRLAPERADLQPRPETLSSAVAMPVSRNRDTLESRGESTLSKAAKTRHVFQNQPWRVG